MHGLSRFLDGDSDNRFLSVFWWRLFSFAGFELTSFLDLAVGECRASMAQYWI